MTTVEGQVSVGVAGKEDGAEVDLEGDGLHPTVHTDIPLSCRTHTQTQTGVHRHENELQDILLYRF